METVFPLPDEIAQGHLGRWRFINGFSSNSTCMNYLRQKTKELEVGQSDIPDVNILACCSEVDIRIYQGLHTLLPFVSFTVPDDQRLEGGWAPKIVRKYGMRLPRQFAHFCPACVGDDVYRRGFSYWRRAHQLPGSYWCAKHPTVRLHETKSKQSFEREPQFWLLNGQSVPQNLPEEIRNNSISHRFSEACRSMLKVTSGQNNGIVRRLLVERAISKGIATGAQHLTSQKYQRLSDLVKEELPVVLQAELCESLLNKCKREYLDEIDGAIGFPTYQEIPRSIGTAFAIIFLYSSVQEAISEFESAGRLLQQSSLERIFTGGRYNISAVAAELKISESIAGKIIFANRHSISLKISQEIGAQV